MEVNMVSLDQQKVCGAMKDKVCRCERKGRREQGRDVTG